MPPAGREFGDARHSREGNNAAVFGPDAELALSLEWGVRDRLGYLVGVRRWGKRTLHRAGVSRRRPPAPEAPRRPAPRRRSGLAGSPRCGRRSVRRSARHSDEHPLVGRMHLTHRRRQPTLLRGVELAPSAVAVAVGFGLPIFRPQQHPRHAGPASHADRARDRSFGGAPFVLETQDLAYPSHRHSLGWHRLPPPVTVTTSIEPPANRTSDRHRTRGRLIPEPLADLLRKQHNRPSQIVGFL